MLTPQSSAQREGSYFERRAGSDYLGRHQSVKMWKAVMILCVVGCNGYFWDLDFGMHGSLKKGSTLTPQSGVYLKDSWRTQVIVPTMERVAQKLREIHRNNLTQDLAFGGSIVVVGALAVLGLVQKKRKSVKKLLKEENNV